mmetsp:Transcript_16980/g.23990  ORF Transcript_16980/g.23990 Transcript_16980/m.23990 type:complete len:106 (-) Transcript_16980:140-457(-)
MHVYGLSSYPRVGMLSSGAHCKVRKVDEVLDGVLCDTFHLVWCPHRCLQPYQNSMSLPQVLDGTVVQEVVALDVSGHHLIGGKGCWNMCCHALDGCGEIAKQTLE